jgi:hypothetical protein
MESLKSSMTDRTTLIAAAVGWLHMDTARVVREQALIALAAMSNSVMARQGIAAAHVLATLRYEVHHEVIAQVLASIHQSEMLAVQGHVTETACWNQYLSSLAIEGKHTRRLQLVPSPSDEQDLGEIG